MIECAWCDRLIDYDRTEDGHPMIAGRVCPICQKYVTIFKEKFAEQIQPLIDKLYNEITDKANKAN